MGELTKNQRAFISFYIVISLTLFLCGCQKPYNESSVTDFILDLPKAERGFELHVVDLSNPDDYGYLSDGWQMPEPGKTPYIEFLWSCAKTSLVRFPVSKVQDYELLLCVRPLVFQGSKEMELTLLWNGHLIGGISLDTEWQTYRLKIASKWVVHGDNTLSIQHSRLHAPSEVWKNSRDDRKLGASYTYFVLRPPQEILPPGNYTLPQVLGAKDFHFEGTQRHVIHDHPPSKFTFQLALPSRPELRFGAGILPETIDIDGGDAEMRIQVQSMDSGKSAEVFHAVLAPPRRGLEMGWTKYRRNLEAFALQTVKITFETKSGAGARPGTNEACWLDPQIFNRHVQYNLVLIPGCDPEWFTDCEDPDSPFYKWRSMSARINRLETVPEESVPGGVRYPFSLNLFRKLRFEGWFTGYFFTGRDELFLEDGLSAYFDAIMGNTESAPADCETMRADCFKWIERVGGKNFACIADYAGPGKEQKKKVVENFLQTALYWLFEKDTVIIFYASQRSRPAWVHFPANASAGKDLGNLSWDDLMILVLNRMDFADAFFGGKKYGNIRGGSIVKKE